MEQSASSHEAWVETEFATLSLGDKRRNERAKQIMCAKMNMPNASIPHMSDGWGDTMGTYRFLANPKVDPDKIHQALADACTKRLEAEDVVIVAQDTTSLDFTTHTAFRGGGPLGGGKGSDGNGIFVHSAMCISDDGVPLGRLHQEDWARDPSKVGSRHERKSKPIEEKESYNWIKTMEAVQEVTPGTMTIIHVGDRESDMYQFLAAPRRPNTYVLVRACRDRCLETEPEPEQPSQDDSEEPPLMVEDDEHQQPRKLLDAIAQTAPAGEYVLLLRSGKDHPSREARIQVRFRQVTLRPPKGAKLNGENLPPVALTVIKAREIDPPDEKEAISWLLLTDLPVGDFHDACNCIRRYSLRWLIERYHFVLKSGCLIEKSQLTTVDGLRRLLALYSGVALRLLWLTYTARTDGDQPCTAAFTEIEYKTLQARYAPEQSSSDAVPTLHQVVHWIARLGGFLGRKHDGEPGVKVIWRGLMRLQDLVAGVGLAPLVLGAAASHSPRPRRYYRTGHAPTAYEPTRRPPGRAWPTSRSV